MRKHALLLAYAVLATGHAFAQPQAPSCWAAAADPYPCLQKVETRVLQADPKLASREGKRLVIRPSAGKPVTFTSDTGQPSDGLYLDSVRYMLEDSTQNTPYLTVRLDRFEATSWLLVSKKTGAQILLPGQVQSSPDGRRLVTTCNSYLNASTEPVSVLRLDGERLVREFYKKDLGCEVRVDWSSDDTIKLESLGSEFHLKAAGTPDVKRWKLTPATDGAK